MQKEALLLHIWCGIMIRPSLQIISGAQLSLSPIGVQIHCLKLHRGTHIMKIQIVHHESYPLQWHTFDSTYIGVHTTVRL